MPPTKTPTSSLSGNHTTGLSLFHLTAIAIELLVKRACYRTLAIIQRTRSGGVSPETSTTPPSPATRLPLEISGIIVSYLIYDVRSLRTYTLTCYSWYIAAVPHLHHTLTIHIGSCDRKFRWPNPIRHMHMLGLLPLVKSFQVCGDGYPRLSSKLFNCCIQRQFSTLANV